MANTFKGVGIYNNLHYICKYSLTMNIFVIEQINIVLVTMRDMSHYHKQAESEGKPSISIQQINYSNNVSVNLWPAS